MEKRKFITWLCKVRRELLIHIKIYANVKWSAIKNCLLDSNGSMSWYKQANYITLSAETI